MIEVELKDDEVTRLLERHLSDMSEAMNSIGERLKEETEQRFEEGVAPDGTPWHPRARRPSPPMSGALRVIALCFCRGNWSDGGPDVPSFTSVRLSPGRCHGLRISMVVTPTGDIAMKQQKFKRVRAQVAGPRTRRTGNPAWRSDLAIVLRPREYHRVTPA